MRQAVRTQAQAYTSIEGLTNELLEADKLGIVLRKRVVRVEDAELRRVFERVLLVAQREQNTAERL